MNIIKYLNNERIKNDLIKEFNIKNSYCSFSFENKIELKENNLLPNFLGIFYDFYFTFKMKERFEERCIINDFHLKIFKEYTKKEKDNKLIKKLLLNILNIEVYLFSNTIGNNYESVYVNKLAEVFKKIGHDFLLLFTNREHLLSLLSINEKSFISSIFELSLIDLKLKNNDISIEEIEVNKNKYIKEIIKIYDFSAFDKKFMSINKIELHKEILEKYSNLEGEIDIVLNDNEIIDIKLINNNKIPIDYILQLKLYKKMLEKETNIKIDKTSIYSPIFDKIIKV